MRFLTIGLCKLLILAFVTAGVTTVSVPEAHANTRVCSSLKAQLARAGSGGNPSQYNKYNTALKKQASELKQAKAQARRGNCSSNKSSQCRILNKTIPKMEANMGKLRNTRDRYAGKSSSSSARQLKAKLKANNCYREVLFPTKKKKSKASVQQVSAPSKKVIARRSTKPAQATKPSVPQSLTSGVRTLCVRTCDGFFFPVSFGADTSQVKNDEQACAAMCPGTETKLYIHKVPEEETEAMVTASGERYVDSPTAFAYLKPGHLDNRPESCSCRAAQQAAVPNQTPVPAGLLQTALTDKGVEVALPALRPDVHADPDTQATVHGAFSLDMMATMLDGFDRKKPVALVRNDAVRVVLPEFLPAPEAAKGLQVPAPTRVQ